MVSELDLLERGYFPKELQPSFVSSSFATYAATLTDAAFDALAGTNWWTQATRHNLARPAGMRRALAVPNPMGYLRVARRMAGAWTTHLEPILRLSSMAGSKPVPSAGPRAVTAAVSGLDLELMRAEKRRGARYLLVADIQNFYPSVYTHAIDWVIHGKAAAKAAAAAKTKTEGSELDRAFRGAQDGQTIGIPIGPDASLIIAECMMTRIEELLSARSPRIDGYRYWDDFELSFWTLGDAEKGLAALQEGLSIYELMLNPRKTRILELPDAQRAVGLFEFAEWDLSPSPSQRNQLIGYFDSLFRCIAADRGSHVAAYAIARLRSVTVVPDHWELVQNNLLQLLVVEPSCARSVAEILGRAADAGYLIASHVISAAVEHLSIKHAPLQHGSEIAWALWICLANRIPITTATARAISGLADNFTALLALHARADGLISAGLDTTLWESFMTTAELRSANWLVSYEASIKGWLPSVGGADHIAPDAFFALLRLNGVSFYDATRLRIPAPAAFPATGVGPGGIY